MELKMKGFQSCNGRRVDSPRAVTWMKGRAESEMRGWVQSMGLSLRATALRSLGSQEGELKEWSPRMQGDFPRR